MRSTYQILTVIVAKQGLELIAAAGERFDPELH